MTINETWLQFATLNKNGNPKKTVFRFPFHTSLQIDQEFNVNILGHDYSFTCVGEEIKTNNDGTVDKVYIVSTLHI
jgi:hypothetical protein